MLELFMPSQKKCEVKRIRVKKFIEWDAWLLILWTFCILGGCADEGAHNLPFMPFAQDTTLLTPIVFADGMIETTNGISFTNGGNKLYISKNTQDTLDNGRWMAGIFVHTYKDGHWSDAVHIDFGMAMDAYHPVLSRDNESMFFNSRSDPEDLLHAIPHNIWVTQLKDGKWASPKMVSGVNGPSYDSYPSLSDSGNLYFNSDRPGGKGAMDIYLAKVINGIYQPPINLNNINSLHSENDLVIDPGEQFIIFNRYFSETNEIDLFISFQKESVWTEPRFLHQINQRGIWELTPTLSPDGKYLFYEVEGKIMQAEIGDLLTVHQQ